MTASKSTAPATLVIQHVSNAPEGIVRLFVPAGFEVSKSDLRNAAAKVAGTINVGRTPAPKPATLKGVKGHGYDFAPVVKGGTAAPAAPAAPAATEDDPRVAALTALGLSPEQIAAALAVVPAAKSTSKGKGTAAAKSPREVPAFLRKWADVTCKTCRDFGYIHGPTAGKKSGKPFRTAQTPATAPTAIPCPSHVTKGKTATARRTSKTA